VLFLLPTEVSVSHAALAEIFFCLTVAIAALTSPHWRVRHDVQERGRISLRALAPMTTAAIYMQILLGALMRHTSSGLAIPDFPLSFGRIVPPVFTAPVLVNFSHRVGAVAVAVLVLWLAGRIFRSHRSERALSMPAVALVLALAVQLSLGAITVWSAKAEIPTTFHVAGGAFTLAMSLLLTLNASRIVTPRMMHAERVAPQLATR
jgi:cytochrome c oxidase assembly protein subunit 15